MTGFITKDIWLSSVLVRPCYRLLVCASPEQAIETTEPGAFIYCKVDCRESAATAKLFEAGFTLAETNLTFDAQSLDLPPHKSNSTRFAKDEDKRQCVEIAGASFTFSRFHADMKIPRALANKVKAEWVGNFFSGKRGSHMVVSKDDQGICGFLQLILSGQELVIDLIGVAERARRKGFAQAMIGFAAQNIAGWNTFIVGTQTTNISSVRLYESLGFRLRASSYTLHCHRPCNESEYK